MQTQPHRFGLIYASLALIIALLLICFLGMDYLVFLVTAPVSTYFTGWFSWKLIMNRKISLSRMAAAGFMAGIVAHYPCWLLNGIVFILCYYLTNHCTDSLGNPPAGFIELIPGSLTLSLFSLYFAGWLTITTGIVAAFINGYCFRKNENTDPSGNTK